MEGKSTHNIPVDLPTKRNHILDKFAFQNITTMKKLLLLLILIISCANFLTGQVNVKKVYCDATPISAQYTLFKGESKKTCEELNNFILGRKKELEELKNKYDETKHSMLPMDTVNAIIDSIAFVAERSQEYQTTLEFRILDYDRKISALNGANTIIQQISSGKHYNSVTLKKVAVPRLISNLEIAGIVIDANGIQEKPELIVKITSEISYNLQALKKEKKRIEERLKLIRKKNIIKEKGKKDITENNYWIGSELYRDICSLQKYFYQDTLPLPKPLSYGYIISESALSSLGQILMNVKHSELQNCLLIKSKNIQTLMEDIDLAENELNTIKSAESQHQEFKKYITLCVSILLGLILVAFFGGVLYKSGNDVKAKLIGEAGLQFITIFVIIIAVILFGIMNILKGSELAAILSAIAGYILGKTAPPKSDKTLEMELEALRLEERKSERQREERARMEEQEKLRKETEHAAKVATDTEEEDPLGSEPSEEK